MAAFLMPKFVAQRVNVFTRAPDPRIVQLIVSARPILSASLDEVQTHGLPSIVYECESIIIQVE